MALGRVSSIARSLLELIIENDPEFTAAKTKQPEYEFSNGRKFEGNPASRGPYAD